MHGGLSGKRAADARALALLPSIRELMAAGFVSQRGLANELNRRGIPAAGGGRWHRTTVVRMLTRLSLLTSGKGGINNELATKRVADVRAEAFRPTIRKLRKAGFVSISAIARELNARGVPTARGGKWRLTTVTRLLERLEKLERLSGRRRR
jgi:Recombinase